ncbi:hypothetical protein BDV36DRAFT_278647 [Aspergillus pseudocaelatus]|uniref:Uncharacterized protein n=1 Tax=Aspergillus pseudocaelatus TaxID=1825620 RepID=A0ABQ6VZ44_9EURO|nr:hypothetical protein BDV36DRAFT_278647 [Aspergillus pseudocaelatus]
MFVHKIIFSYLPLREICTYLTSSAGAQTISEIRFLANRIAWKLDPALQSSKRPPFDTQRHGK